ncbi:MAG: RsmD family RNA methyltransferase [Pirellulaceae bacterium]|nr:RsmD family RNA methyltransferase [Pirellulaceae bacterium]HJN07805.1 RsmD family RNA methyltransferase [Pirellulaceae bacterium]
MKQSSKGRNKLPTIRIIGGDMRGRAIRYDGDLATRPMKDRVREAAFNLLGPTIKGKHVIDLFAGTGAMAFEAISRGAANAVLIERRFPNARLIRDTAAELKIEDKIDVFSGDTFNWVQRVMVEADEPTVVFCCPPYDFYLERWPQLSAMIDEVLALLPSGSVLLVESDGRFETTQLPDTFDWDVRAYPPAVLSLSEIG